MRVSLEVQRERIRQSNKKLKLAVIGYYSNHTYKCNGCEFADLRALQVDHINGHGRREKVGQGKGYTFYRNLKKRGFPPGYQILCANCNFIKRIVNHEFGNKYSNMNKLDLVELN